MVASLMLCLALADQQPKMDAKPNITFILVSPSSKVEFSTLNIGLDPDGSLFDGGGHYLFDAGRGGTLRVIRKLFYAEPNGSPKKLDLYLRDEKGTSFACIAEFMQRIMDVADDHTNVIVYVRLQQPASSKK